MKRLLSAVIALLIMFSSLTVFSSALSEATIEISTASVHQGDEVVLDISLKGNPGICAMYIDISYDKSLTLKSVRDCGLLEGALFAEDISSYPYRMSWDSSSASKNNSKNGVIAQLCFYVAESCEKGTYPVSISYDKEEIYNSALNNVSFSIKNGGINVSPVSGSDETDTIIKLKGNHALSVSGMTVNELLQASPDGTEIKRENSLLPHTESIKTGDRISYPDGKEYVLVGMGDADMNGTVTAADARLALRQSVGLEKMSFLAITSSDTDFSGDVTASDARSILRCSVGLDSAQGWLSQISTAVISSVRMNAPSVETTDATENFHKAGEYVVSQLELFSTVVDISAYRLNKDDAHGLINEYVHNVPSLFYVNSLVNIVFVGDIITELRFTFMDNAKEKKKEFREMVAEITALGDRSWSEMETALFYHDYICKNFTYDTDYKIYDPYNLLKEKKGVCQAYALLYMELLRHFGIETEYVSSDIMTHGWNVVKIDGKWYHVDVTWDDPLPDVPGSAHHSYFLLSDDAISRKGHRLWSFSGEEIRCTSKLYDDYLWEGVDTPFTELDGYWYYIDKNQNGTGIFRTDFVSAPTFIKELDSKWNINGFLFWDGFYSGLGKINNKLIYNSSDKIFAYDPVTKEEAVVYTNSSNKQIYGCVINDNVITGVLKKSPNDTSYDVKTISLAKAGDVNSDAVINAKDYTLLIRYISSMSVSINEAAADYNSDGYINKSDADSLRWSIVNKY